MKTCRVLNVTKSNRPHVKEILESYTSKFKFQKIDQNIVKEKLAMAIIRHDFPFSFVEYEAIRDLLVYLHPDIKFVTKFTTGFDVWKLYEVEKEKLKKVIKGILGRVCLTSNTWTTCSVEGYICVIIHYVKNEWKLNNKILAAIFPP